MSSRSHSRTPIKKSVTIKSPRRSPVPSTRQLVVPLCPMDAYGALMVPSGLLPDGQDIQQTQRVTTENYGSYTTQGGNYVSTSFKTVAEKKITVSPRK